MARYAILEGNGFAYDYFDEVEAETVWQARKLAADRLGGAYSNSVRHYPDGTVKTVRIKRDFKVRKEI